MTTFVLLLAATCVSPDGRNAISFEGGERPVWCATRDGKPVTAACDFGLRFARDPEMRALDVVSERTRRVDATWHDRFGGNWEVRDNANETTVLFRERDGLRRTVGVVMRAYDEGVAFRHLVPEQPGMANFAVAGERTTFRFKGDPLAWYAAYDSHQTSQEGEFLHRSLRSLGPGRFAQLPAVVETPAGFAAICEADLAQWPGAFLTVSAAQKPADCTAFEVALSPAPVDAFGGVAGGSAPARSPWRVLVLADDAIGLVRNKSIVPNLNPPPEGGDAAFDWVKPGASSWDWWYNSNNDLCTSNTMAQIDFAAEMGWPYHTIDAAWYGRPAGAPGLAFEPRPGYDLPAILAHAARRNVGLLLWVHWKLLEANGVEETFAKFERWGVKGVKIDFLNRQDALMVGWCEKTCRIAAKHRLLVNFHGAFHPTGMNRTWPNQITREGVRGNEISKWEIPSDALNPATLVFTRFLAGPGDYTPGGFGNVHARDFVSQIDRGHLYGDMSSAGAAQKIYAEEIGTRAHALALCVALDSPLMTLCDCPERYRGAAGIDLLRRLPTTWRRTVPLAGEIGSHYAVAREAFDGRVYLAAQTVAARALTFDLGFLGGGEWRYEGVADDPELTPREAKAVRRLSGVAQAKDRLSLEMVDEGGALVVFTKK